jgi:hypothetical protein
MRLSKTTAVIVSVLFTAQLVAQESNQMMIEKSAVLKDLEFQPFYEIGSRTFKVLDDNEIPENSSPPDCGYCTALTSYSPVDPEKYSGIGMNVNYARARLFLNFSASIENHHNEISQNYRKNYHHPHVPFGTFSDYYEEKDYLTYTNQRMVLGFGIGVKIFKPNRWFNIIPKLKFSNSYTTKLSNEVNYSTKKRVSYWDLNPTPSNNYSWDSTFVQSNIEIPKKAFDCALGIGISLRPIKNIVVNFDFYFPIDTREIVHLPTPYAVDKLQFRYSFGVGYRLPLKGKSEKIANKSNKPKTSQ